jgi:hypothetical protein
MNENLGCTVCQEHVEPRLNLNSDASIRIRIRKKRREMTRPSWDRANSSLIHISRENHDHWSLANLRVSLKFNYVQREQNSSKVTKTLSLPLITCLLSFTLRNSGAKAIKSIHNNILIACERCPKTYLRLYLCKRAYMYFKLQFYVCM